jgi:hypothetical protein
MLADMMPRWLYRWLDMDSAVLPTDEWTWRHTWRYGYNPANILRDEKRYRSRMRQKE